jgi:hypothetical protein
MLGVMYMIVLNNNNLELSTYRELDVMKPFLNNIESFYIKKGLVRETCMVVDSDGEELSASNWVEKHKYDGLEVRK